tara:strand:+ start:4456 stop:5709 length:1254 start_codon:yes stop_codon:yes gene_type:complete
MNQNYYFKNINILKNSSTEVFKDSVVIINNEIIAFGENASKIAKKENISSTESKNKLLAPLLVDIHSTLEDPISGFKDDLIRLKKRAKRSGYGVIALLPDSNYCRDKPEKIPSQVNKINDIQIFFWGSFTFNDEGLFLSQHDELLKSGSIGLSSSYFDDLSIMYKGMKIDSCNSYPLLISSKKNNNNNKVFAFEDIQALQAGFHTYEQFQNKIDLDMLMHLQELFKEKRIIIKNIFDPESCQKLKESNSSISATINWWNLIADTNNLKINDIGWKIDPPLNNNQDRNLLIRALEENLIDAIAVNSIPLSDEDIYQPINERKSGISSFELVLPLLWEEFITKRAWKICKLWKHLSFLPSQLIGIQEEELNIGNKRWLIFDPDKTWINSQIYLGYDSPSNIPKKNELIKGCITAYGLAD